MIWIMRKSIISTLVAICLLPCATVSAQTTYVNTPVTISKEKIRSNGNLYYSHVVLERQTLFSICKAYNVTADEVYAANPTLNIKTEGLKKNQIILIPVKDIPQEQAPAQEAAPVQAAQQIAQTATDGVITYVAKWYDDLDSIAAKFGVSKESIMKLNGLKDESIKKKQKIKIPAGAAVNTDQAKVDEPEDAQENAQLSDEASETIEEGNGIVSDAAHVAGNVNLTMILPLNAKGSINNSNFDFYSGALLAIKDLAAEGISTKLTLYDYSGDQKLNEESLTHSNIVIGPISSADINAVEAFCPSSTYIVSPLDSRVTSLTSSYGNIIQAPSSTDAQNRDLISWIKQDMNPGDKLIIVSEKNAKPTALAQIAAESGLPFQSLSYGILEGRNVTSSLNNMMSATAANRVVIASDSEAFVNDVVRNLNLMVFNKYDVVLYAPSRIRNFETIEVENLHKTKLHLSASYYVDYESTKVKHFLMSYRALFSAEPTPYAYQGYDTAYQFISQCAAGSNWTDILGSRRFNGLQSDFHFERTENGSFLNTAVRRVEYGTDYSIRLISQ